MKDSAPHPVATASHTARLTFLDALRGVAAFSVVIQHVLSHEVPGFLPWTIDYFSPGRAGVVIFFLISGFVIPMSLGRIGQFGRRELGSFWIGRVLRLYPAYWTSLALLTIVGALFGRPVVANAVQWFWNLTMLQGLVRVPDINQVAWTLLLEILTYIAFSLAAWRRWLAEPERLVVFVGIGLFVASVLVPALLHKRFPGGPLACLAAGLAGYAGYLAYKGAVRPGFSVGVYVGCLLLTLIGNYFSYVTLRTGTNELEPAYLAAITAVLLAYALGAMGYAWRARSAPRWLTGLGTISYSLYLLHGVAVVVVLGLFPSPAFRQSPLGMLCLVLASIALGVLLSIGSYLLVERPSNELGRRWRAKLVARPLRLDPQAGPASPGAAAPDTAVPEASERTPSSFPR